MPVMDGLPLRRRAVALLLAGAFAGADAGAAPNDIVIAQVGPFTGTLAVNGVANYLGAKACIESEGELRTDRPPRAVSLCWAGAALRF